MPDVLTRADLNRATLARQMLLAREKTTVVQAVERLAGLQAQLARPPFIGLWSRVEGFKAEDLARAVHDRQIVRATLMRATLHLMTAGDYHALRPALQPMLTEAMQGVLGDRAGFDLERVITTARAALGQEPRTFEELRAALAAAWPGLDERALGYAVRTHLPLVQVPTDARWGWPSVSAFALADRWTGRKVGKGAGATALVLRYLGAFGPASVRDAQAWSGMRSLGDAFADLRPKLSVFHDEKGRELFDLPKAPRPNAKTTRAPVRFLPDYDNLVLGHSDRTRIVPAEHRPRLATKNLQVPATFLVDGFVAGTWKIERARASAALSITAFEPLSRPAKADLTAEGKALLRFVESDAKSAEVRFS